MLTICVGTGKLGSDTRHEEVVINGIECPACMAIEAKLDAEGKLAEANLMLEHSDRMMAEQDEKIAKLQEQRTAATEIPTEINVELERVKTVNRMFDAVFGPRA